MGKKLDPALTEYLQQHARYFVSMAGKIIEKKESANLFRMTPQAGYRGY